MRKKNQISKYHALSPRKLIKTIHELSINEKLFNLVGNWRKVPKNLWLMKNFLI